MKLKYYKYHALWNDFVILDRPPRVTRRRRSEIARKICHRRAGVGADGLLWLSRSTRADRKLDVYNADGGWAEKSGNGLRIAAVHLLRRFRTRRHLGIETGSSIDQVRIVRKIKAGWIVHTELGQPIFESGRVPVKTRKRFVVNTPLRIGGVELPMTCLSVGNPHAVLLVDNFDFDWRALGAEIETARVFPHGTNVEFVKRVTGRRLRLCEWERGVGATGSSGTGAAAAVCALVMLGLAQRNCRVEFEAGSLDINWDEETGLVELTGPVSFVTKGEFEF